MRNNRNIPLSQNEIRVIEELTQKWDSQRQISKITWHARRTIQKYQKDYRVKQSIKNALDKYYGTPDIKIYTINYWLVCSIIFIVFALALAWIYFLINL
jgi:hypothetical protein